MVAGRLPVIVGRGRAIACPAMTGSASNPDPSFPALSTVVTTLRAAGCVFAEDEAALLLSVATDPDQLAAMIGQRVAGLPLEQIVGFAEFCGLRVAVEPGVFVPRRRSEFLVRQAVAAGRAGDVLLDLCCGSGAIGMAVAAALDSGAGTDPGADPDRGSSVELHAADIEPAAVRCARRNLQPIGGRVHAGDLFDALPPDLRGRVDLLVVNAPYVPTDAIALMPREARLHEPRITLDGGSDGVDVHRRIGAAAPAWLSAGGRLLIETSEQQAQATAEALSGNGLRVTIATSDEWPCTVVNGRKN